MRVILILLTLMILSAGVAKSQNIINFNTEKYVGFKGGYTLSKMSLYPLTDPYSDIQPIIENIGGYNYGVVFRVLSERHFGLQTEINYVEKGWTEATRDGVDYSRDLSYIEVPIFTHVNLGNGTTRFIMNIGPSVSYLISDSDNVEYADSIAVGDRDGLNMPYYGATADNNIDFGFIAGGGFEFNTKAGSFILEARYSLSLLNIFAEDTFYFNSSMNNQMQFSLTYLMNINKKDNRNPRKYPKNSVTNGY